MYGSSSSSSMMVPLLLLGGVSITSVACYMYRETLNDLYEYVMASDKGKEELDNIYAIYNTIKFVEENIGRLERIAKHEKNNYRFGGKNEFSVSKNTAVDKLMTSIVVDIDFLYSEIDKIEGKYKDRRKKMVVYMHALDSRLSKFQTKTSCVVELGDVEGKDLDATT